jgi:hypothetical protein
VAIVGGVDSCPLTNPSKNPQAEKHFVSPARTFGYWHKPCDPSFHICVAAFGSHDVTGRRIIYVHQYGTIRFGRSVRELQSASGNDSCTYADVYASMPLLRF